MEVSRWVFPLRKLLFFNHTTYLAEIAYFCSPNRELWNGVRLVWLYRNKNFDHSTSPHYSDNVCLSRDDNFCLFEGFHFSVLRPILLKLHLLTHLIQSFSTVYGLCSSIGIKMSIHLAANTTMAIYARSAMSIFAFWRDFILQSYVLSCWNCIFYNASSRAFRWCTAWVAVWKKCRSF